ncbi:(d)CMP kinase [bacterium]|nr:(d)CMP kinase [bacterium]MBU1882199.1 (d)CMP kinase [bacterium]
MTSRKNHQPQLVIAVDGPAAAGKTTTAREVARRLCFIHLDTGAMYRALALHVLRKNANLEDPQDMARSISDADIDIQFENGIQHVLLNGEDVTDSLRTPEVSFAVTPVCEVPEVRRRLVKLQRQLGKRGGLVAEGRDMGTVVFPDALLKVFMTADLTERAKRRKSDLDQAGIEADETMVSTDLERRDQRDSSRIDSPLKKAHDAFLLDTSNIQFEDQVEKIIALFKERLYEYNRSKGGI